MLRSEKIDARTKSDEVAIWVAAQSELKVKKRRKDEDVNSENTFRLQKRIEGKLGPNVRPKKGDSWSLIFRESSKLCKFWYPGGHMMECEDRVRI